MVKIMELGEIISDALAYPLKNIKALAIYAILGIILGIVAGSSLLAVLFSASSKNVLATIGSSLLAVIVTLVLGFFITGYQLDIMKFGIERREDGPGIDFVRQFLNGVKLFVVNFVYMIIPMIIGIICGMIFQNWLSSVITFIVTIIFALGMMMAQCRLAKTEDFGYALNIGEAIKDVTRVGLLKLLLLIILIFIIVFILVFIVAAIAQWNSTIGGILMGILGVYIVFFVARATGLLYSDV